MRLDTVTWYEVNWSLSKLCVPVALWSPLWINLCFLGLLVRICDVQRYSWYWDILLQCSCIKLIILMSPKCSLFWRWRTHMPPPHQQVSKATTLSFPRALYQEGMRATRNTSSSSSWSSRRSKSWQKSMRTKPQTAGAYRCNHQLKEGSQILSEFRFARMILGRFSGLVRNLGFASVR